ncbi:MAG: protein kinase [Pirellulaceae bacterium]|nr:protein kinase [Pirellulaceae bacterium]
MSNPTSDPSSPSLIGRQLGDYRVLSRLGRGGMAQVYLAEQLSLGRLIALKILKPELATDQTYINRFRNEARAAAALVHSNIVQIFEVGEVDGWYYIAQEYVAGMNLSQYLRRNGPVSSLMAVNVMTQIAAALKKASAFGVVHRDIKPENIMLSTDGEVKVADFGLARLSMDKQRTDLTQIGVTMGTPLYMSPEQIEGGAVDHRADLYSFGVTCYHMLTGRPPFRGDNPISVAIQHAKEVATPIENSRPDLARPLIEIVNRLMAKRPADRFQEAGQVLEALSGVEVDASAANWQELLKQLRHSNPRAANEVSLAEGQLAATRRLEVLMRGPRLADRLRFGMWMLVGVVAMIVSGSLLARAMSPPDRLQRAREQSLTMPPKDSIADQYMYAYFQDSEDGWDSVIHYFEGASPPGDLDSLYVQWAKERLAEFYLGKRQWAEALKIYNEFSLLPQSQKQRTISDYGSAICQYHLGDPAPAKLRRSDTLPDAITKVLKDQWSAIIEELDKQ